MARLDTFVGLGWDIFNSLRPTARTCFCLERGKPAKITKSSRSAGSADRRPLGRRSATSTSSAAAIRCIHSMVSRRWPLSSLWIWDRLVPTAAATSASDSFFCARRRRIRFFRPKHLIYTRRYR